ncbi:MAG: glycosyltransferase [Geminicoccaceae bacterium]
MARRDDRGRGRPDRPELLFVSPTLPDDRGNGLAMRGALFLRAFCGRWNVRLLVVDLFGTGAPPRAWPRVTQGCAEALVIRPASDPLLDHIAAIPDPAWRAAAMAGYRLPRLASFAQPTAVRAALACLGPGRFDRVHAFRLYMAPFAAPFLGATRSSLDADDDDACAVASMADLPGGLVRPGEADAHRAESARWARFAADWAPRFDLVSFAAPGDAERVGRRLGLRAVCVPNAVRSPVVPPAPGPAGPFTLLFVGTMGYPPNLDAAFLLAREVLPALRRHSPSPLRLVLVGGPAGALAPLAGMPDVVVAGRVAELRPFYAASHVVLAPLRAGGGTRIKILEAMAHARPVVATPVGAEGLAAEDGIHLLLGTDAEALAAACHRLQCRPELAATLSANGRALVARRYARTVVTRQIRRLMSDE